MAHEDDLDNLPVRHLAKVMHILTAAMAAEGVSPATIQRVRNRAIWGNPEGDPEHHVVLPAAAV